MRDTSVRVTQNSDSTPSSLAVMCSSLTGMPLVIHCIPDRRVLCPESPSLADRSDIGDRLVPRRWLEVTGVENVHADVRLDGYDDGNIGQTLNEGLDDMYVLNLAECK